MTLFGNSSQTLFALSTTGLRNVDNKHGCSLQIPVGLTHWAMRGSFNTLTFHPYSQSNSTSMVRIKPIDKLQQCCLLFWVRAKSLLYSVSLFGRKTRKAITLRDSDLNPCYWLGEPLQAGGAQGQEQIMIEQMNLIFLYEFSFCGQFVFSQHLSCIPWTMVHMSVLQPHAADVAQISVAIKKRVVFSLGANSGQLAKCPGAQQRCVQGFLCIERHVRVTWEQE